MCVWNGMWVGQPKSWGGEWMLENEGAHSGNEELRKTNISFNHEANLGLEIVKSPIQRAGLPPPLSLFSLLPLQEVIRDRQKLTTRMPALYLSWEEEQKS